MKLVQAVLDHPEAVAIAVLCCVLGTGKVPRLEAVTRTAFHQLQRDENPCEAVPAPPPAVRLLMSTF